jgi:hypothetical protein
VIDDHRLIIDGPFDSDKVCLQVIAELRRAA